MGKVLRWYSAAALALTVSAGQAVAQQTAATITGRVISEQSVPIEGANIFITQLGVSVGTNAAGRYRIVIPAERVRGQTVPLQSRSIGFAPETKQVTVRAGEQTFDFTLKIDVQRLTAVVTTGVTAGTELAKIPFQVTRIDSSMLQVPGTNPLSELQGKVPGANIVSGSGRPGSQPSVLLRGPKSINASGRGQDPLYVVDGVILQGGLPDLNPQDIESVEVVEGAAAASLYGARAGNGVIQITTKSAKGAPEGVRFTIRSEYGVNGLERKIGIAQRHALSLDETNTRFCVSVTGQPFCGSTIDYLAEQKRINNAQGDFAQSPPSFPVDPGSVLAGQPLRSAFQVNQWPGQTYDAVSQFAQPKPLMSNNVDMTGRFGGTSVFASVSNLDQGGSILFLNGFQRQSLRLNVDQKIADAWTATIRTFYSRGSNDGFNQEDGGTAFFRLTRVPPVVNLLQRDSLGRLFIRPNLQGGGQQNENALYSLENTHREDITDRFIGSSTVRYSPFDFLDFEGNFAYDLANRKARQFNNKGFRTTVLNTTTNNGFIFSATGATKSYNTSIDATVRHDFTSAFRTRTTLRYLYDQQDTDNRSLQGNTLAVIGIPQAGNVTAGYAVGSSQTSIRGTGLFVSENFELKERYILDALVRRDGSSLFGANNRYATFGRVAGAWIVSSEPWWHFGAINQFKLRSSYGTAGGRPNFSAQYETYTIGTGGITSPNVLGNANLRPEITTENEYGVDIGLFDRITANITVSKSDTKDQILPVVPPSSTGFQSQWQNAGTLQNKTLELSLDVPIIERRDFSWSAHGSYDHNRAVITKLNVPPFTFGTALQATGDMFIARVGEKFGTFYGRRFLTSCSELPSTQRAACGGATSAFQINNEGYLVWVGDGNSWRDGVTKNLWQTQLPGSQSFNSQPLNFGMPIVQRDSAGGPILSPLGHALPDYRFSLSNNIRIRRLTLYGLLDASIGQSVYNQGRHWSYLDFLSKDIDQTGKTVETAKPLGYYYRSGPPDNSRLGGFYDILGPNNRFVEDASYAKIREVLAAYHVGPVFRTGDWSVSVIGRNLKTFTKYKGFDPEVGVTPNTSSQAGSSAINAVDAFQFPNLRSVTFAISTAF
ncbi:MAG: SusC/RagA family TonB-linked outer membrane protein [Gemmatimonadaceae bacterium]